MNAELAVLKIMGLLAAEIALVCLPAVGGEVFLRSAVWRRTLWQVCVLSVLLVAGLELSGLGRSLGEFVRPTVPPRDIPRTAILDEISPPAPWVETAAFAVPTVTKPEPTKNGTWQIALGLASVWMVGTGFLLGRILLTRTIMLIICARSTLVSEPALRRLVQELAARMGMRGTIRIVESPRLRGPMAFGLARRVIGLPLDFAAGYSPAQQEVILAHELAHLSARDSWWQLLADAAVAVLWWHPLVWLARRRLQDAAEAAADEASMMVPNGPSVLAECLLALGKRLERAPHIRWSSIGGDGFRSGLGRRVRRLLELREVRQHRRKRIPIALAKTLGPSLLVAGAILSSGWISPAASMKGTGMKNPMWKRSLPAFALLAFLGAEQEAGAADKPASLAAVSPGKTKPVIAPGGAGAAMVRQKLKEIRLDVQVDNLPLSEVIRMLIEESRNRDPEKVGINILLHHSEPPDPPAPPIDPKTGLPIPVPAPEPVDLNAITVRIMPALRNVRLIDALDAVIKTADRPLRYSIEDYGVLITQGRSKAAFNIVTRTFVVNPPDVFFKGIQSAFGIDVPTKGDGAVSRETQQQVFQELFRHLGVEWVSPQSAFYNEHTGIVMVRAAPEDMVVIAATMQTLGGTPLAETLR